jgi:hypothetical protein
MRQLMLRPMRRHRRRLWQQRWRWRIRLLRMQPQQLPQPPLRHRRSLRHPKPQLQRQPLRQTHCPSHPKRLPQMRWLTPHYTRQTPLPRLLRPRQCPRSLRRMKLQLMQRQQLLRLRHG